jgi:predicted AAA+ superfamily ATPase
MIDYFIMVRRHITDHLLQTLADTPVTLVNGPRQSGKSTLVQSAELIEQGRQYLTFDDPGVLGMTRTGFGFAADESVVGFRPIWA